VKLSESNFFSIRVSKNTA